MFSAYEGKREGLGEEVRRGDCSRKHKEVVLGWAGRMGGLVSGELDSMVVRCGSKTSSAW